MFPSLLKNLISPRKSTNDSGSFLNNHRKTKHVSRQWLQSSIQCAECKLEWWRTRDVIERSIYSFWEGFFLLDIWTKHSIFLSLILCNCDSPLKYAVNKYWIHSFRRTKLCIANVGTEKDLKRSGNTFFKKRNWELSLFSPQTVSDNVR